MDDTMLSPFFQLLTLRTDQLITLPLLVCCSFLVACFVLGFGFCVFLVCFVSCFCRVFPFGIVTANRTLYWSSLSSAFEVHICEVYDVFALINRICQYATGLQTWWTTWRKLWGVGRKKKSPDSTVNPGGSASGRDGFWRRGPSEHRNDPCVQHGRATRPWPIAQEPGKLEVVDRVATQLPHLECHHGF